MRTRLLASFLWFCSVVSASKNPLQVRTAEATRRSGANGTTVRLRFFRTCCQADQEVDYAVLQMAAGRVTNDTVDDITLAMDPIVTHGDDAT